MHKCWRGWRVWGLSTLLDIEDLIYSKKPEKNNNIIWEKHKLMINNRRYLGKQRLIPFIKEIIAQECRDIKVFADIFAGTGVVAYEFNNINTKIIVNDILFKLPCIYDPV